MLLDFLHNLKTSADRSFLLSSVPRFVDPVTFAAFDTVEFVTLLTEVTNILKIKFGSAIFAFHCLHGLGYETFMLGFCGEMKRSMITSVWSVYIDSLS